MSVIIAEIATKLKIRFVLSKLNVVLITIPVEDDDIM